MEEQYWIKLTRAEKNLLSALLYNCIIDAKLRAQAAKGNRSVQFGIIQQLHGKVGSSVSDPFLRYPSPYMALGLSDLIDPYIKEDRCVTDRIANLGSKRTRRLHEALSWCKAVTLRRINDNRSNKPP